jgi:hypothetical protein
MRSSSSVLKSLLVRNNRQEIAMFVLASLQRQLADVNQLAVEPRKFRWAVGEYYRLQAVFFNGIVYELHHPVGSFRAYVHEGIVKSHTLRFVLA